MDAQHPTPPMTRHAARWQDEQVNAVSSFKAT